jgi:hypothetical protein
VIVSDNDDPGLRGSCGLANCLWSEGIGVVVVIPPAKDLRAWANDGATRDDMAALIAYAIAMDSFTVNPGGDVQPSDVANHYPSVDRSTTGL